MESEETLLKIFKQIASQRGEDREPARFFHSWDAVSYQYNLGATYTLDGFRSRDTIEFSITQEAIDAMKEAV